jgi:hypothetical protein
VDQALDGAFEVQVCQKMFINTLGISYQTVRTAVSKKMSNTGAVPDDKRGKKSTPSLVSTVIRQSIIDHINKFPRVESHYCRKHSKAKYLDEHLDRAKMHRMYVLECSAMDKAHIGTKRNYRDVFKANFNLKFYKPKKDQCPLCLSWKHKSAAEKTEAGRQRIEEHLAQKRESYKLKDEDVDFVKLAPENRKTLCVLSADLQKILSSPKGENGEFFYLSKFSSYNFTTFVSGDQQGYCFTWDQTTGKKGCTEVTSCMWIFIQLKVKEGITEFRIYSDNCYPQNKNQYLFSMYVMASIRFNIKITHRYLESGHTLLPCDNMHARIETSMKKKDVFVPSQWVAGMRCAKVNNPPYIVREMAQEDFLDFHAVNAHQSWGHVRTAKIREIVISGDDPFTIRFKNKLGPGEVATVTSVQLKTRGRPVNYKTFTLERKYPRRFPVEAKKLKGLQGLCKSGSIPAAFAPFYMQVLPAIAEEAAQAEAAAAAEVIESDISDWEDLVESAGSDDDSTDGE